MKNITGDEKLKVLEVNNLKKSLGKRDIIKEISFSIEEGEIFGFLGPNGVGKTTTIRMLVGLIHPNSGSIKICGHDLKSDTEKALKEVGAVVENPELYKYLKDNNIKPIQEWEYNEFTFFKNLCSFFGFGLLIAGISVFMSDIVSGECIPATLKFLLVQPVKRGKILFSKFTVSIVTVLSLIIIPQLAGMVIVNATSNIHASDYPIRI